VLALNITRSISRPLREALVATHRHWPLLAAPPQPGLPL